MVLFQRKWIKHYDQTVFDLMDLDQFRSSNCRYVSGYIFMYFTIILSIAVYVSDIYTALVLLAFDRWTSSIKPFVPFRISRWIFAACIILSIILLIYEFIVAVHTMRGKNVALNYANPISRNLYSIYGYKYFCLFAKITKSRNKTEYLALFVYFTFKGWLRLVFADSPRQVLNALTLYSVLKIDTDFVDAVQSLANNSLIEAVVVSFMAFSLLIWVINVLQFIIALMVTWPLYVHIDKEASGLEEYIFVRVNRRIAQLVDKHHKRGLVELKEANRRLKKQPTLPSFDVDDEDDGPQLRSYDSRENLLENASRSGSVSGSASASDLSLNPFSNLSDPINRYEPKPGYGYPSNSSADTLPLRMPSVQDSNGSFPSQGLSRSGSGSGSGYGPGPGPEPGAGAGPGVLVRNVSKSVRVHQPQTAIAPDTVSYHDPSPTYPSYPQNPAGARGRNLTNPNNPGYQGSRVPYPGGPGVARGPPPPAGDPFRMRRAPPPSSRPKPPLAINVPSDTSGIPPPQPTDSSSIYTEQSPASGSPMEDQRMPAIPAYPSLVSSPTQRQPTIPNVPLDERRPSSNALLARRQPTLPDLSPMSPGFPNEPPAARQSLPFAERIQPGSLVHRAEPPMELVQESYEMAPHPQGTPQGFPHGVPQGTTSLEHRRPTLPNYDAYDLS
uniref:ARAD1C11704p n=1 Tax=Blastobotrys adeninivorans TaxID=409370 RepID=A0A060T5F3_BLAAD